MEKTQEKTKYRRQSALELGRESVSPIEEMLAQHKAEKRARFGAWFEKASREGGGRNRAPVNLKGKEREIFDRFDPKYPKCQAPIKDDTGLYNERCCWECTDEEMDSRTQEYRLAVNNKVIPIGISLKQFTIMKHGEEKHFEWWWEEANQIFRELYGKHLAPTEGPPAFDEVIFPDWLEEI